MKTILEDIKNGTYQRVYLLYGDETYLKIQYKQKLLHALMPEGDSMNFHHYQGKGIEVRELIDHAQTLPFFADYRILLLEDTGFFKNKSEELAEYIKNLPDYVCMIFVESEVDKRNKLYKAVKEMGRIVEFTSQNEKTLGLWVAGLLGKAGRRITQKDMELFLAKTGSDMGNISMETEKLISYTEGKKVVTAQDIEAICTVQTETRIFEMVRAVTEKKQKKALELYRELLVNREPPMRILFFLSKQYLQMLQAKRMEEEGMAQPEMAQKMGVPSFALRNIVSCAHAYQTSQLEQALWDFAEMEEAVKTGKLEDTLSVELLILKYSSLEHKKADH